MIEKKSFWTTCVSCNASVCGTGNFYLFFIQLLACYFAVVNIVNHELYKSEANCIVKFLYFLHFLMQGFPETWTLFQGLLKGKKDWEKMLYTFASSLQ